MTFRRSFRTRYKVESSKERAWILDKRNTTVPVSYWVSWLMYTPIVSPVGIATTWENQLRIWIHMVSSALHGENLDMKTELSLSQCFSIGFDMSLGEAYYCGCLSPTEEIGDEGEKGQT